VHLPCRHRRRPLASTCDPRAAHRLWSANGPTLFFCHDSAALRSFLTTMRAFRPVAAARHKALVVVSTWQPSPATAGRTASRGATGRYTHKRWMKRTIPQPQVLDGWRPPGGGGGPRRSGGHEGAQAEPAAGTARRLQLGGRQLLLGPPAPARAARRVGDRHPGPARLPHLLLVLPLLLLLPPLGRYARDDGLAGVEHAAWHRRPGRVAQREAHPPEQLAVRGGLAPTHADARRGGQDVGPA
jgi:hypothetical protein